MGIKSFIKRKREEGKQTRAANLIIRKKARAAGFRERETQQIKVAKEKERIKAQKKITYAKRGGFTGSVSRGLSNVQTNVAKKAARTHTKTKRSVKKTKKKHKRSVKKAYKQPSKEYKRPSLDEHFKGFNF